MPGPHHCGKSATRYAKAKAHFAKVFDGYGRELEDSQCNQNWTSSSRSRTPAPTAAPARVLSSSPASSPLPPAPPSAPPPAPRPVDDADDSGDGAGAVFADNDDAHGADDDAADDDQVDGDVVGAAGDDTESDDEPGAAITRRRKSPSKGPRVEVHQHSDDDEPARDDTQEHGRGDDADDEEPVPWGLLSPSPTCSRSDSWGGASSELPTHFSTPSTEPAPAPSPSLAPTPAASWPPAAPWKKKTFPGMSPVYVSPGGRLAHCEEDLMTTDATQVARAVDHEFVGGWRCIYTSSKSYIFSSPSGYVYKGIKSAQRGRTFHNA